MALERVLGPARTDHSPHTGPPNTHTDEQDRKADPPMTSFRRDPRRQRTTELGLPTEAAIATAMNRRSVLGLGVGLGALATLAACGSSDSGAASEQERATSCLTARWRS